LHLPPADRCGTNGRPFRRISAVVSAVFLAACSETTTPPLVPAAIELLNTGTLSAVAGQPLADSVTVRVVDPNGLRIEGVPVTFLVTAGGGSVSPASNVTGAQGVVKTFWTLGAQAGVNRLEVRAQGLETPLIVEATGSAGSAASFVIVSGNGQTDTVGRTLPNPVVLRLTDANGNPIAGAAVDWYWGWSITSGTITPASPVTNANGEWSATWTLATEAGQSQVTAVARASGMALGVTATGLPEKPDRMTLSEPGSVVEFESFTVQVRSFDRFGNHSAGLPVNLTPTNGSTVNPAALTTDANGNGFASWTMPSAPAGVQLIATTPNSSNADTADAAVIHSPPVRVTIIPDTAYSIPMSFDSSGAATYHADMRDQYDHVITVRPNCADFQWTITPPAQIRGQVGLTYGNAIAWSDQRGTYTVTGTCVTNGLSSTAVLIVQ
jgi:hypothetical protein